MSKVKKCIAMICLAAMLCGLLAGCKMTNLESIYSAIEHLQDTVDAQADNSNSIKSMIKSMLDLAGDSDKEEDEEADAGEDADEDEDTESADETEGGEDAADDEGAAAVSGTDNAQGNTSDNTADSTADNTTVNITVNNNNETVNNENNVTNVTNIYNEERPGIDKEDAATLQYLTSDEERFVAEQEAVITFTVEYGGTDSAADIQLYRSGVAVGNMHDDGLQGDDYAGDGIYTLVLAYLFPDTGENYSVGFYAQTDGASSNETYIYVYPMPTEETVEQMRQIGADLEEIDSQYCDDSGTMSAADAALALQDVKDYADTLLADGLASEVSLTDCSVVIELTAGITMVYEPWLEDTYAGGTGEIDIYTFQPLYDWVSGLNTTYTFPGDVANEAELLASAANHLDEAFSNVNYNAATSSVNHFITQSDVQGFGANQIILWQGHGVWGGDSIHSLLLTSREFQWDDLLFQFSYFLDCLQGRIVYSNGYETLSAKYISHYCGDLTGTYLYLGPCHSGQDRVLAQAFLDKGAAAVIGNSMEVVCLYGDLMEYTATKLLADTNPDTGNNYTLGEALAKAKEWYGQNDAVRFGGSGAEPILYGNANYALAAAYSEHQGLISGRVSLASDHTADVEGAIVTVLDAAGTEVAAVTTGNDGTYQIYLDAGEGYTFSIRKDGYMTFTCYVDVEEDESSYLEAFLLVADSGAASGTAKGHIYDAVNGNGLEGVQLEVRPGWNSTSGSVVAVDISATNSSGDYSVELPLGNYTLHASKDGYVDIYINIVVQEGTTSDQNGTMSPFTDDNEYRIVLTWGLNPRDLDSHLVGLLSDGRPFHVYYANKVASEDDLIRCQLDVDDVFSYGPETVTLVTESDHVYYYYVHLYAGVGTLPTSEAQVKVYQGSQHIQTFNVPTSGSGLYWNVFAIVNGEIVISNTITATPDTTYAGSIEAESYSPDTQEVSVDEVLQIVSAAVSTDDGAADEEETAGDQYWLEDASETAVPEENEADAVSETAAPSEETEEQAEEPAVVGTVRQETEEQAETSPAAAEAENEAAEGETIEESTVPEIETAEEESTVEESEAAEEGTAADTETIEENQMPEDEDTADTEPVSEQAEEETDSIVQISAVEITDSSGTVIERRTYTYGEDGQLQSETLVLPNGTAAQYTIALDGDGRLLRKELTGSVQHGEEDILCEYDSGGAMTMQSRYIQDIWTVIQYAYNEDGTVQSETWTMDGEEPTETTYTHSYTALDTGGMLDTWQSEDGTTWTVEYDDGGHLVFGYDAYGDVPVEYLYMEYPGCILVQETRTISGTEEAEWYLCITDAAGFYVNKIALGDADDFGTDGNGYLTGIEADGNGYLTAIQGGTLRVTISYETVPAAGG